MKKLPSPALPEWLAAMLPVERYCVEVDGWKLHVMASGRGRPVLALHGNPSWGFLYRKVAHALAGEPVRVVMPDLLGLYREAGLRAVKIASSARGADKVKLRAIAALLEGTAGARSLRGAKAAAPKAAAPTRGTARRLSQRQSRTQCGLIRP